MWTPITLIELFDQIQKTETDLNGELRNFWQLIRIEPKKWSELTYGNEGNGFWVVAICGQKIIWYNDIEDGFNISNYTNYGQIDGYFCNQEELSWAIRRLYELIIFGGQIQGQAGPPSN
ncbi:MAG: hypothetical protein RL660_2334 [Bacteroidota bacterium]|jgi:hypothetical protein